jgi:hypothetical protein
VHCHRNLSAANEQARRRRSRSFRLCCSKPRRLTPVDVERNAAALPVVQIGQRRLGSLPIDDITAGSMPSMRRPGTTDRSANVVLVLERTRG